MLSTEEQSPQKSKQNTTRGNPNAFIRGKTDWKYGKNCKEIINDLHYSLALPYEKKKSEVNMNVLTHSPNRKVEML